MNRDQFFTGVKFLYEKGLNLFSVMDCKTLPDEITTAIAPPEKPFEGDPRLVMAGNGGPRFWETFKTAGINMPHPVDSYSISLVEQFLELFPGKERIVQLFPPSMSVPLQKLGHLAGWSHPSPLGLDIHQEFGPWFAYRVVFLTDLDFPLMVEKPQESACDTCVTKDCFSSCLAGAIKGIGCFDVSVCTEYRLAKSSKCARQCTARLACHQARDRQYSREQVEYHYTFSLNALKKYLEH